MIDISTERIFSFTEATRRLPERRGGKRPNVATLYRWSNQGCRGVRLEYLMVGGTRCTSLEALQRFFELLTAASLGEKAPPPPLPKHRLRQIEAAERRLAKAGA